MNRTAFIFYSAPHGSSAGREGLDALLALSTLSEEIGVFFINDGIFQILAEQKPNIILAHEYIVTFKLLLLHDIKDVWVCSTSIKERGLKMDTKLILDVKYISSWEIREHLTNYNVILTF